MSNKKKYILLSIILAVVFSLLFGFGLAFAEDDPRLSLRISAAGLLPSNIQWFEKLNRTYFQEASEWVSTEASANAAEPEFSRFLPGLNAEFDLAVVPRLMLGLGFGWMSQQLLLHCIRMAEVGIPFGNQITRKPGKTGSVTHSALKESTG